MANVLSAPQENSVLIDANLTEIILDDSSVGEYFHYAKLYINNSEFDRVIIPKISNTRMILTFSNILLKSISFPTIGNSNLQYISMDRNLKIEVYKKTQSSENIVNTFNYLLRYCTVSTREKYDAVPLNWIGVKPETFIVSENTIIQLPFYSSIIINMFISIVDNTGIALYQGFFSQIAGQHTFLLNMPIIANSNTEFYTLKISVGGNTISKNFKVLRNSIYESKLIQFYNHFGFPMTAELFGKLSVKDELIYTKYQTGLGVYKTADVSEETTFTIDSGYLVMKERAVVTQILNSLNTKIKYEGQFIDCITSTKSITTFIDAEFLISNQLVFEFNKNPKMKN